MSQLSENKQYSIEEILEKLRSEVQKMPVSPTSARYLRALESLESTVIGTHGSSLPAPSMECAADTAPADPLATYNSQLTTTLTDWLVNLWLLGTPFTTASLYLDIISSLYGSAVKSRLLPKIPLFSELKAQLKALGSDGWKSGIGDEIFARALRLTRNASLLISDDAIAADLVLLSLTHSLIPLESIALLKREDLESHAKPQSKNVSALCAYAPMRELREAIVARHLNANGRRKYIFPLRQSERTPAQLKKHVAKIVNALFRRARLPQSTDPNQTVEALWTYAALRTGIPATRLVSYLGHAPLGLPVLKLSVVSCQLSESGQAAGNNTLHTYKDILREAPILRSRYCEADTPSNDNLSLVGKVFLENPPRWYAMSLRPGVRFTQVCRRIQLLSQTHTAATAAHTSYRGSAADTAFSALQLFYPCEEIARAIGKKIVIRERPFIHSVVFFRAKLTDIGLLFAKIGDLAWCYRQSARPGAPYADISERQFHLFQQTIAQFTPDYEVAPTGELELKKDDRVQIVGGLFAGQEATFDSAAHVTEADAPTVYRLNIIGDNGIEWRISVDSRLAKQKNN
ncbi:MAG: hypothetical protein K2J58_07080 [Muribaculaceae bacterium]|nr:hypothetical protein [Muribaculaceae bacterium]